MSCTALIVAGGAGRRMGGELPKQFLPLLGIPLLARTLRAFEATPEVDAVCVVGPRGFLELTGDLLRHAAPEKAAWVVEGGEDRPASVQAGLARLPAGTPLVAVHDGARPLANPPLISRVIQRAALTGAAIPALPVQETLKAVAAGHVERTLDRRGLWLAQTPQVFDAELLRRAYRDHAAYPGLPITDDAQLVERLGHPVSLVEGDPANIKITVPADLRLAEAMLASAPQGSAPLTRASASLPSLPRVGSGHDFHRLVPGRPLVLGGVSVAHDLGLLGHSDADVLAHAVADALLGAAGLGDLGAHFPDSDERFRGADSLGLLAEAGRRVRAAGFLVGNLDATLICQAPRLGPHLPVMARNLARALDLDPGRASVKATTSEGMGFAGRGEGVEARAVVLIFPVI